MMEDREFLKELIRRGSSADKGYFKYAHIVAVTIGRCPLMQQLHQLVNGPVWDGDVMCKSLRDELLSLGLAVRVCKSGEQGYTGATYFAYTVVNTASKIEAGMVGA